MGTMVIFHVKGGTLEQYDKIMQEIFGTLQPSEMPDGLWSHAAAKTDDGFKVVDIWESQSKFEAFGSKLMPAIQNAQMPDTQPKFLEVYNFIKS